ncbi:beta-propeller domain-containing protein [Granulicella arctica]|uniref:beta-propeller domain-containing protein n=1 Tax=Granulicella arctica TaxID=940613 RepID=UPI0021E0CC78|nr:PQQ-binding-like beta-propeller repeat protein [Granulicella arctica]
MAELIFVYLHPVFKTGVLLVAIGIASCGAAQMPATLPGRGLAQHDFLYAGESHNRRIFIVRDGKIVWSYDDPGGRGEISDAVMLSNGNILFAHQYGVTEITREKKVVWNYDAPDHHEVHTALPIGNERVLYIQNGEQPIIRVVNIVTGRTEKELPLAAKQPISVHGQFRHARLTPRGTLLVAHMDLNKVVEYDSNGKELWSFPASTPWGVTPLANGNALITDRSGTREVTHESKVLWSFSPADAGGYKIANPQQAWRLPNGNTVVDSWSNEWNPASGDGPGDVQAIEVTPAKEIVWVLREWTPPSNLGPATTLQFLDEPSAPEDVHFGPIH